MNNNTVEFGKWVEFESVNGGFSYSDDDRTLRYVSMSGENREVTAPDGCVLKFCLRRGTASRYCVVPSRFDEISGRGAVTGEH